MSSSSCSGVGEKEGDVELEKKMHTSKKKGLCVCICVPFSNALQLSSPLIYICLSISYLHIYIIYCAGSTAKTLGPLKLLKKP